VHRPDINSDPVVTDADQRYKSLLSKRDRSVPVPIEGASNLSPWEQVEPVCNARTKRAIDDAQRVIETRTQSIIEDPYAAHKAYSVEREWRLGGPIIAQAAWTEWQGCIAEYGWRMVDPDESSGDSTTP
jgi:hypothetical protein